MYAKALWLSAAMLLLLLLASQRLAQDPLARADAYGALITESVAGLAVAPLLKQDRIELGLLTNRLARLPAVTGVTVLGVDSQVLSITNSNPNGRRYRRPISMDNAVVGYVEVTVDPAAVAPVARWPWLLTIAAGLLMPWLLLGLEWILRSAEHAWQGRAQRLAERHAAAQVVDVAFPEPQVVDDYLVVASLLNQLSLPTAVAQAQLQHCAAAAAEVAALYNGRLQPLPGNGVALWFDSQAAPGTLLAARAEEVACAALLLAQLLQDRSDQGRFQLALHHHGEVDPDQAPISAATLLTDAALLAAAAGEGQVIISDTAFGHFADTQHLAVEPLTHPLGADLSSASDRCQRLTSVGEQHGAIIARQLQTLRAQSGATDSESTF